MVDRMDPLLLRAEVMLRSTSRGVPFGPLLESGLDAIPGRRFRQSAQRTLRLLLGRVSSIL